MSFDATLSAFFAMAMFGFTGSLHCAAMCGTLAATACGTTPENKAQRKVSERLSLLQYHGTRVVAYTLLGFAGGLLSALLVAGTVTAASRYLGVGFGIVMTVYALVQLTRAVRLMLIHSGTAGTSGASRALRRPSVVQRLSPKLYRMAAALPFPRPVALGLATAFLPCGFLLAALLQSTMLANPVYSGIAMTIFAIASSPALLAGSGILALVNRVAPRLAPVLAASLLLAAALVVLWRSAAPADDLHCHPVQSEPMSS